METALEKEKHHDVKCQTMMTLGVLGGLLILTCDPMVSCFFYWQLSLSSEILSEESVMMN